MNKINPPYYKFFGIALIVFMLGCEDDINPNLEEALPLLAVDAWITDKSEPQAIRLSFTRSYFENSQTTPLLNASVSVDDNLGNSFVFVDQGDGDYVWAPANNQTLGVSGTSYTLSISAEGEQYTSEQIMMNPVPLVDSVTYRLDAVTAFDDDEFIGEFWSRDLIGEGDTYWIRSFLNGQLLSLPSEINIAFDAGFVGSSFDGLIFIPPIRDAINPLGDLELLENDSLYVEIHSITNDAYQFLSEVQTQTDRDGGFGELFASPFGNVPTNISNVDPNSEAIAVGFFNVAAVSGNGRRLIASEVSN